MAGKFWREVACILGLMGFFCGCAGAPPPERPGLGPPPTLMGRNSQEVALERGLGEFYGAPYRSGGTTPAGVDCSGLIQALFQRAGVMVPRTVALQYSAGRPVAPGELRFGDVVFFNRFCQTRSRGFFHLANILPSFSAEEVCHDGIYIGDRHFIHASPRGGGDQSPGRRNLADFL